MKQIRRNVFETNSSSVHSLCISRDPWVAPKGKVAFFLGHFDWGFSEVNPGNYLYTAIYDRPELLARLEKILKDNHIDYEFHEADAKWDCWDYGIDHGSEAAVIAEAILSNEDQTLRFLFSPRSAVYTGNDNERDCERDMCYSAIPNIWDYNAQAQMPNPNHHPDKFEYYMKGN